MWGSWLSLWCLIRSGHFWEVTGVTDYALLNKKRPEDLDFPHKIVQFHCMGCAEPAIVFVDKGKCYRLDHFGINPIYREI